MTMTDATLFSTLVAARASRAELAWLGLSHEALGALLARHGIDAAALGVAPMARVPEAVLTPAHATFVAALRARLLADVDGEASCVERGLSDPVDPIDPDDARCLATIIAHACLRPDHLWRDLGLSGRDDVSAMLTRYFPALVARNVDNLRWKHFLARDLALSRGEAPAPAPGCPGCEDYRHCFPAGHAPGA